MRTPTRPPAARQVHDAEARPPRATPARPRWAVALMLPGLLCACAPGAGPKQGGRAAEAPQPGGRDGGYASLSASDPCVEARPDGRLGYRSGCQGERPVLGDVVVSSEADATALCADGDWIVGDLTLSPGAWSRAELQCLRGVEGRLGLDLTDAAGLEGLDRLIRVGELQLVGEGDASVDIFADLLSADVLSIEPLRTVDLRLAPQLDALGALRIDSPDLQTLGPAWPLQQLDGLIVETAPTELNLQALSALREISGDAIIEREATNLLGLSALEEVGGELSLSGVRTNTEAELRALLRVGGPLRLSWSTLAPEQFPNLEEVGGLALELTNPSTAPVEWSGFGQLRRVYGDLSLSATFLGGVSGFNNLEEIDGDLTIAAPRRSYSTTGLSGFGALQRVGGDLWTPPVVERGPVFPQLRELGRSLWLNNLGVVTTLGVLESVGSIDAIPTPLVLPALRTIAGDLHADGTAISFGALEEIGGRLIVSSSAVLPTGLDRLHTLGALLYGSGREATLRLPSLTQVGQLQVSTYIYGRPSGTLHTIDLPALEQAERIHLSAIPGFSRLSLPSLQATEGDLRIDPGSALSLIELGALETVGGHFTLSRLGGARQLALPSLRAVAGDLTLDGSGSLESLSAPALEQVGGVLEISDGPRFTGEAELDQLRALGGLRLLDNDRLVALPAFPALSAIEGELRLHRNLRLTALDGLSAVRWVGGALEITDNRSLDLDEIDALMSALDAPPAGGSTLSGNGR